MGTGKGERMKFATRVLVVLITVGFVRYGLAGDTSTISRSPGPEGGVIVLWPRIIPGSEASRTSSLAKQLQARLKKLVGDALPGRVIEKRPEPERVCPQAGCRATSVGLVLARKGQGCVAVVVLGRPGRTLRRLVPWIGKVKLKKEWIPFRKPPESFLTIEDFARCDELVARSYGDTAEIEKMIRAAEPPPEK